MAINFNIYSPSNITTKTVTVDFIADYLAANSGVSDTTKYFFKFTTSARKTDNSRYDVKIAEGLNDLVLDKGVKKQRITDTAAAYTDIKSMVMDYIYDYIHGHDAGQYGTTVREQLPMKFN